jgi:putative transposase
MMTTVLEVGPKLGVAPTCAALGLSRETYYRRQRPKVSGCRRQSPRALGPDERSGVLALLHEPRFVDLAPAQVYASLLDEGRFVCSLRTMHRILAANREVRERRNVLRHPEHKKPELLATGPNQVWSWDISAP